MGAATTEIYTLALHDALPIYTTELELDATWLEQRDLGKDCPPNDGGCANATPGRNMTPRHTSIAARFLNSM